MKRGGEGVSDATLYYLWLTIGFSPCNPRKWDALSRYDSVESLYANMKDAARYMSGSEARSLSSASLRQAEEMLEYCRARGIGVFCPEDKAYPDKLRRIANPPSVLFARGRLEDVSFERAVAVIGAREAEEYSINCTKRISSELAAQGITVISGFARGIDTAAHEGAINGGGKTVAVLGCGIEYDYPKNSGGLKSRIIKNGAVISEYFPSQRPCPENFKVRNRICSALSDAVVCMQASAVSGALNTAYHAAEQGKDIFVLPPADIYAPQYQGQVALLRDGAELLLSTEDIINRLSQEG